MKSKLLTKKSFIAIILTVGLLIGLSYIANKTIVEPRLEAMAYQKEYATEISADGLYLVSYEPDSEGNKIGGIFFFIGSNYLLKTAEIPSCCRGSEIKNVDEEAFKDSESVEKITLPQTIESIEDNAFANCKNLEQIYIPSSVTKISSKAFSGTTGFTMFVEKDSYAEKFAEKNGIELDYYTPQPTIEINEADYPKMVNEKQYNDFFYCVYYYNDVPCCVITSYNTMNDNSNVDVPKEIDGINVTTIAPEAFSHCQNAETITLPDTVTAVGAYAFSDCVSLKRIVFNNGDTAVGKEILKNSPNVNICASKGSYAYDYAIKNNINFEEIDSVNF